MEDLVMGVCILTLDALQVLSRSQVTLELSMSMQIRPICKVYIHTYTESPDIVLGHAYSAVSKNPSTAGVEAWSGMAGIQQITHQAVMNRHWTGLCLYIGYVGTERCMRLSGVTLTSL
jgi:hypothetical protein